MTALRLLAALLLPLCLGAAAPGRIEFAGSFRSFSLLLLPPPIRAGAETRREAAMGALNSRLRLQLRLQPLARISLDVAYDLSPRVQDPRLLTAAAVSPAGEPSGYRCADLPERIYPRPGAPPGRLGLFHGLDRLNLTLKLKFADISLGRQAVAWGSARIVNPTDIIAPFAFNALDPEERPGVDALRVRIPLGTLDELDLGWVAGDRFAAGNSAFFLRGRTYFWKSDLSLLALAFRDHLLLGADLSRSIGGAGIWLEMAHVSPFFFQHDATAKGYFRASLGADFNFRGSLYAFLEYHFSSAGESRAENALERLASPAFRDGAVYLLGRHYLGLGASKPVTGLLTASGLLLANLDDPSLTLSPRLEYNVAENVYIAAGAYIGLGQGPESAAGEGVTLLRSEFGAYPDLAYASIRIYF